MDQQEKVFPYTLAKKSLYWLKRCTDLKQNFLHGYFYNISIIGNSLKIKTNIRFTIWHFPRSIPFFGLFLYFLLQHHHLFAKCINLK